MLVRCLKPAVDEIQRPWKGRIRLVAATLLRTLVESGAESAFEGPNSLVAATAPHLFDPVSSLPTARAP